MSTAEDEPIDWDNFVQSIEALDAVAATVRPVPATERTLPDDDDIGHFTSVVEDLAGATSDDEKVAVLKTMTRWLAQWKF